MNRTALIYESLSLDWFGVIVAAACFIGLCAACLLRKIQKGSVNEILTIFCIGTPLALILGRVQYCLSKVDLETLGPGYIFTGMHDGGYGLYGAMAGILIAILITAALFKSSIGELTDCIATVGAGVIAAGRFATRFTLDELGFAMQPNMFTVKNDADGLDYLAVFYLDGIVESVIFVFCFILFLCRYCPKNSRSPKGNITMIFLILHGLNQVVMDSLNTVTLCLFGNEFIKASQIIGIVSWLVIIIVFFCRLVKKHLFKKIHGYIIPMFLVLIIVSVLMEYRVGQNNYISAHIVMGICMVIMAILSMIVVFSSEASSKHAHTATNSFDDFYAQETGDHAHSFSQNNTGAANNKPANDLNSFTGSSAPSMTDLNSFRTRTPQAANSLYSFRAGSSNDEYDMYSLSEEDTEDEYDVYSLNGDKVGVAHNMYPFDGKAQTNNSDAGEMNEFADEDGFSEIYDNMSDGSRDAQRHRISNDTVDEIRKQFDDFSM